ncbi:MAG: ABC transporter substrate-binding protein [Lachnospiraceae bacterium]|nr:ABC transporter substrate-binding protein [Lachnospiraceae bacterium]
MKRSKKILLSVMTLVVTIALCACGGDKGGETSAEGNNSTETTTDSEAAGKPVKGGEITVGITQDLDSLDPHNMVAAGTREVMYNVFEGLVKADSNGNLVPAVASDYDISKDAKEYTFILRDGITFHDGSPVTVEDVKYSIERYAGINSSAFSSLAAVEIIDESTVKVVLNEGNTEFLSMLTLEIVPQSNEANFATNPIGTGPFKFVSYTPGQDFVVEAYDGYWNPELPYLDKVTFKIVPDTDTAIVQLQAGTIDVYQYLTADMAAQLTDKFDIVEGSINYIQGLFFSQTYEPLQKLEVRQAINYAVDKNMINDMLFNGQSQIIGTHMIPAMGKFYNEETNDLYPRDVEKAKELLKEAGYENGFDLVISVPNNYVPHMQTAEIIVENLKEAGINATIEPVEWNTWLTDVYGEGKFQATITAFTAKLDAATTLRNYYKDSPTNFMKYHNEEFEAAYAAAKASIDDAEKTQLYRDCLMILSKDAAAVYIQDPANLVAMKKGLEGYEFYPISAQDVSIIHYVQE